MINKKVKKISKTVLEFFPFKDVWNNYVYLDDDKIIGGIKINSINLSLMFNEEQKLKVEQLKMILNSIDYPIKIFNVDRPANFEKHLEELENRIKKENNKKRRQLLEQDYQYTLEQNYNSNFCDREFYLIIEESVERESLLKQKINEVMQQFNNIGLSSKLIESEEWRELLYVLINPISSLDTFKNDVSSITKSFKEKILPTGLKIGEKELIVGDSYISVITLIAYPSWVSVGWLSSVANVPNTRMTITISPMDSTNISTTLKKSISEVKSKLINVSDYNDQILLNNQMQDYVELVNRLDREHEKFGLMTINFLCYAETKEQLSSVKKNLKNILNSYNLGGSDLMFEQKNAYRMCLPILERNLEKNYGLPMPMLTIASSFPFIFQNLQDEKDAIILGINMMGSLVAFDIWKRTSKRNNSNAVIIGKSGSGKSTAIKKIARGNWARGVKIIWIDPEREARELCNELNGTWIDVGTGISGMINPLEVRQGMSNDSDDNCNDLARHFQTFRTFLKYYFNDISEYEMTKIEEVLLKTYQKKGIDFDTALLSLTSEDYPIMEDFYQELRNELESAKQKNTSKKEIESLEKLSSITKRMIIGADAKLFNGKSSISKNISDFIVLDIYSLLDSNDTIVKTQFFNILSWAWNEISKDDKPVILIVDEAHLIIDPKNRDGLDFLKNMAKRIRKRNGSLIISSQNLIDFCSPDIERYGQVIIDNATYLFLMAQGRQEIDAVNKMMCLSESETQFLLTAGRGEGLFVIGQDTRLPIKITLRDEEKIQFGTSGGK